MLRAVFCGLLLLNACIGYAGGKDTFAERRKALLDRIGSSIAVLRGMPEPRAYVPFRQDNDFYYLTGVETPGAVLLLDGFERRSILFLPSRERKAERWEGMRLYPGPQARQTTGVAATEDLQKFNAELAERMKKGRILYTPFSPYETAAVSRDRAVEYARERLDDALDGRKSREEAFRDALRKKFGASAEIRDLSPVLDAMRRVKDSSEIEVLRAAGRIGALGMKEAMRAAAPGMYEYQLAATAEFVFLWQGALGNAYFAIVGSGPNSCILHYSANRRRMEAGDVVVMDAGPDYAYYAADVTRTFPVSGKFSAEQAAAYRAVLKAQKAALAAVRPGSTFEDLEDAADQVLEHYGYDQFTMHAVGHYVGMAVHDVGEPEPFEAGSVIAVEPGVYIPEKNLGIRIEDTVLVTKDGCEILTRDAPKEISEIEKLMSSESVLKGADHGILPLMDSTFPLENGERETGNGKRTEEIPRFPQGNTP